MHCDVHADAGVGRARPARDERDARPPRHRAVGTRHEADAAFLPARHRLDLRRVMQRVEHREKALAGDMENAVAALKDKLIDENAAAGAGSVGHAWWIAFTTM
jgi:hypothetical protein